MKLKITPKFLLTIHDAENRGMCSVRINHKLYAYAKADAKKKNMKVVEYMNNLLLSKVIHDNEGEDIFECLNK